MAGGAAGAIGMQHKDGGRPQIEFLQRLLLFVLVGEAFGGRGACLAEGEPVGQRGSEGGTHGVAEWWGRWGRRTVIVTVVDVGGKDARSDVGANLGAQPGVGREDADHVSPIGETQLETNLKLI